METIQTLMMMMMLHWKSIFNFITMKLTFTSLFYTCRIFGLVSRLFYFLLFSFFRRYCGNFYIQFFFFVFSSFKMRHMPLFLLVEKDLYALRDESDFIELWIPVWFLVYIITFLFLELILFKDTIFICNWGWLVAEIKLYPPKRKKKSCF